VRRAAEFGFDDVDRDGLTCFQLQKFFNNIKGDDQFELLTLLYDIYIFDQVVGNVLE
jgi:hypothetical protein